MDGHIRLKRDGRQRRTIGDAHEDAARHRIAIEGDAELGERGTVGRCYLLCACRVAHRFFREFSRSVFALVKIDIRPIGKIVQRKRLRIRHRVARGQGHARRRLHELGVSNARCFERLVESRIRSGRLEQNAQFAHSLRNIINDALRRAVAQRIGVLIAARRKHGVRERLHIEEVVLT